MSQAAYQRDREQMTRSEEDEHEAIVADAEFRLHILDKRLKRHEEVATRMYQDLEARLTGDTRLTVLVAPAA
jgi:hypothetical protein